MTFIFWSSIFAIFYVYLGYPISIWILSLFKKENIDKKDFIPSVTILIAAYNEKECIEETILNKLELDYPKDKIDIIVISDESSDGTDEIVNKFASEHVTLMRQSPRAGKTMALNYAVPKAKGDILVFSDANSIFSKDALTKLVQNFNAPEVGYVSGKMIYVNDKGSPIGDGCSAYMKYENFLRDLESKVGSIVGVDGGIDAVRKKLYKPMNADQLPDFVLPLKVIDQGYRVIYEPGALLKEQSLKQPEDEYRMRVRVTLRALWALYDMRHLLLFKKNTQFSWQLWSHKVLRYLCFIFIITAFFSNIFILGTTWEYSVVFFFQIFFYLSALATHFLNKKRMPTYILYYPYYFLLINIASAHAAIKFLLRQKMVIWNPRKG